MDNARLSLPLSLPLSLSLSLWNGPAERSSNKHHKAIAKTKTHSLHSLAVVAQTRKRPSG